MALKKILGLRCLVKRAPGPFVLFCSVCLCCFSFPREFWGRTCDSTVLVPDNWYLSISLSQTELQIKMGLKVIQRYFFLYLKFNICCDLSLEPSQL